MIRGETKSGFEFEVNEEVLDDWEIIEKFDEIQKGDIFKIIDVIKMILGNDGYIKLKNHVKEKTGKLKTEDMQNEILDILHSNPTPKNS